MIRVKIGELVVECDTAAEAADVVKHSTYSLPQREIISRALCKAGTHTPAKSDPNHCESCGTCLHAGMC